MPDILSFRSQSGAYLSNNTGLSLLTGTTNGVLQLDNTGAINLGSISANLVDISTQGVSAPITISNKVLSNSNIRLVTNGTGANIVQGNSNAKLVAPSVYLNSAGSIGNPVITSAVILTAIAQGGDAFVSNSGSVINLTGSSATGKFTISNDKGISIDNLSGSAITVYALSGAVKLLTGGTITAKNGNVQISNADNLAGQILFGANTSISASNKSAPAFISVFLSNSPVFGNTTAPNTVTVQTSNNGNVYFGPNSILANIPQNNIFADNGTVRFDTAGLPSSAITLGGNVTFNSKGVPVLVSTMPSFAPSPGSAAPLTGTSAPNISVPNANNSNISTAVPTDKTPPVVPGGSPSGGQSSGQNSSNNTVASNTGGNSPGSGTPSAPGNTATNNASQGLGGGPGGSSPGGGGVGEPGVSSSGGGGSGGDSGGSTISDGASGANGSNGTDITFDSGGLQFPTVAMMFDNGVNVTQLDQTDNGYPPPSNASFTSETDSNMADSAALALLDMSVSASTAVATDSGFYLSNAESALGDPSSYFAQQADFYSGGARNFGVDANSNPPFLTPGDCTGRPTIRDDSNLISLLQPGNGIAALPILKPVPASVTDPKGNSYAPSPAFVKAVQDAYNKLPPSVQKFLSDNKVHIETVTFTSNPGTPAAMTESFAKTDPNYRPPIIQVGEFYHIKFNPAGGIFGASNTLTDYSHDGGLPMVIEHESGHAIDALLGLSTSPAIKAAWQADVNGIGSVTQPKNIGDYLNIAGDGINEALGHGQGAAGKNLQSINNGVLATVNAFNNSLPAGGAFTGTTFGATDVVAQLLAFMMGDRSAMSVNVANAYPKTLAALQASRAAAFVHP